MVRAAREDSFRVIPVLLPGGEERAVEEISRFLRRHTWVDFRAGLDDEEAFLRFLAGIQGKPPGPIGGGGERPPLPYRCMAPARDPFVQRSEYTKAWAALLQDGAGDSGCATTLGITTAIHGAGGFGKTALAIELCYDEQVREKYPDGILWTTMGEEIDPSGRLARVRDLIRWWTEKDPPAFETVFAASAHLREELNGKRVLLVVDDVWRPEDIAPFQSLPLLCTTRASGALPAESVQVHVDALEVSEAVRLLGQGLLSEAGVSLRDLATRLGEWPLLLKIVNRQLRELIQQEGFSLEQSLFEVNEALDAEGLTAFDREDLESRNHAVARTVGASLRRLAGDEISRFEQLAIFPEDEDIPFQVLEKLWALRFSATKTLCNRLHDLSLLLRFDRQTRTIRLHDVIRAYVLKRGERHLPQWHRRLLDSCRPASGRWPDLPPDESYLWIHLLHHLIGAGQRDVCRELLLDFRYLASKLVATDVNALLADYSVFTENDQELRLVRDSLRLSAHVLARNPGELPEQLWGRLLNRQELGIRGLLQASEVSKTLWLRPRRASLTQPGGPLIRIIDHPGRPTALIMLPSGRMVSGSEDGTLRLWDVESGKVLQEFEGHSSEVSALARLDSYRVVSGHEDGTLRLWDVESGKALQEFEGYSSEVRALVALDSRRVIVSSEIPYLWDVESGKELRALKSHEGSIVDAALDSRRVISGSLESALQVWDIDSGQTLHVFELRGFLWFTAVAVLDSYRLIAGDGIGTLRAWDIESGKVQVFEGNSSEISAVAVLDSRRVISGSEDGKLRVWDLESGQVLQALEGHSFGISAVVVLDSRRIVSGSHDGTLRMWDIDGGKTLDVFEGHSEGILALAVLEDGCRVVSGSFDRSLRVWNVDSGQSIHLLEGHLSHINAVTVVDSRRVVSSSEDTTLRIWDVESGNLLQVLEGHSKGIRAVAVLDSQRVISGSDDGTLRVWDLEKGQASLIFRGSSSWVLVVVVLDRRRVVASDYDEMLQVWDLESGQVCPISVGDRAEVVAVLDSSRVVTGSYDGVVRVWDVERGKALQILGGHSDPISDVAVLDSRRVVSGSRDGTLRVWDVESGNALQILEGSSESITGVAVLDSRRVVFRSDDRTLRVWNVESGEVECVFTLEAPVYSLTVIPHRRVIVAGDGSGGIHFFDFVEP